MGIGLGVEKNHQLTLRKYNAEKDFFKVHLTEDARCDKGNTTFLIKKNVEKGTNTTEN